MSAHPPLIRRTFPARLLERFASWAIERARRTPYRHLAGYMERFWLFRLGRFGAGECGPYPFFGARVHHILRSDLDEHPHNHPWPFVSLVLRGGYWEQRPVINAFGFQTGWIERWRGPGSIAFRGAGTLHRVRLPVGSSAWTLFITGPKLHDWGFLVNGRLVPWQEYLPNGSDFTDEVTES